MADGGKSRALTRKEFDSVMKRATELAMSDPEAGEGSLDDSEVFRIAREVGIPEAHVRRALVDVRSQDVPVTMVDRWYGSSKVTASRVVSGKREEVGDTLDDYLVAGHMLQAVRRGNEVRLYRPAVDWLSNFARAGQSQSERVYWAGAKAFEVRLRQMDDDHVMVELDVDPGTRGELVAGGAIGAVTGGGGAGFGVGLLVVTFTSAPLLAVPAAIVTAGALGTFIAWATGVAAKKKREEVRQELEGVLDALERGDHLNPPPASWRRWVKRQADRFKVELFGGGSEVE
jgi:hypothetical protein